MLLIVCACGATESGLPVISTLDEAGADGFVAVTAGRDHACALTSAGVAYCWGSDADQQLGHPASAICDQVQRTPCSPAAQRVVGTLLFRSISAGARHTCGISADLVAYCWGANDDGALGSTGPAAMEPRAVEGDASFVGISAGSSHTCALTADGAAYCWGRNDRGQLGTNDTLPRAIPTAVSTTARFLELSSGLGRTCGRATDGSVRCWGAIWLYRDQGLEFTRSQLVPQLVPTAPTLTGLSVGAFTTCGLSGAGAVCWEANPHGEMGNGTLEGSTVPRPVAGGLHFVSIAAGIIQTCGVAIDGGVYCWGNDTFGQLGVSPGSLGSACSFQQLACSLTPVRAVGWREFSSVSTGLGNHVCGVTRRTNVYCWGLGNAGQLGFGRVFVATSQQLRVVIAQP